LLKKSVAWATLANLRVKFPASSFSRNNILIDLNFELIFIRKGKPALYPSIGNWQLPCRSHYWIEDGAVKLSYQWTEEKILAGRKKEEHQRKTYYSKAERRRKRKSIFRRFWNWAFGRK
jgi:hypothetical protein